MGKRDIELWNIPQDYHRQMMTWRTEVSSKKEIETVKRKYNGKADVFITTCAYKHLIKDTKIPENVIYNMVFTEYDGLELKKGVSGIKGIIYKLVNGNKDDFNVAIDRLHNLKKYQSYNDMLRVHEYSEKKNQLHIVFMSGRFFHLYPICKDFVYKNQGDVILNYQNYVMNSIKSKYVVENRDNEYWANLSLDKKEYEKELEKAKKGNSPFVGIDKAIMGDTARHGRLQNTINMRSGLYCIPLTHGQVHSGYDDIIEIARKPQYDGDFFIGKRIIDLRNFDVKVKEAENVKVDKYKLSDVKCDFGRIEDNDFKNFIFSIFPKCLWSVFDLEPEYDIRWQACRLLIEYGYSPTEIIDMFKKMRWIDFDVIKTTYQVNYIYRTASLDRSEVRSCMTMKSNGYCISGCSGFSDLGD